MLLGIHLLVREQICSGEGEEARRPAGRVRELALAVALQMILVSNGYTLL